MSDTEGFEHHALDELETNPEKPGARWELSPVFGLDAYNVNVAVLDPDTRLSQNAYHSHDDQTEFYYVTDGRCRVELPEDSLDVAAREAFRVDPGVAHLVHNPFDAPCELVAIGSPPEGRYPVHSHQSYADLLEERYGDEER